MNDNIRRYTTKDSVLFNSQLNNVLSNMYNCRIDFNNTLFNSTEQLFQYLKFSQNEKVKELMLKTCNGFESKQLANRYNHIKDDDYEEVKYNNMLLCLQLKFEQCKDFRRFIQSTGNRNLVEYQYWCKNGVPTWGTRIETEDVYMGINATGRLMMKIREDNK